MKTTALGILTIVATLSIVGIQLLKGGSPDLVGIPVPAGGEQFIFWASDMSFIDDAGNEIPVPRPEFNPDVPSVFWA